MRRNSSGRCAWARYLIALLVTLQACSQSSPVGTSAATDLKQSFLTAQPDGIFDDLGRSVMLRGFNMIALRSDRNRPQYRNQYGKVTPVQQLFDLKDIEDADFQLINSMGVNTLRLVVTWEFAQPDPPPAPYNETYFKLIDNFIAKAKAHGMYVVFDFGQFGWGRSIGGNAGAPDWTVGDTCRQLPDSPQNLPPQASLSVGCAYFNFWTNQMEAGVALQDAYIDLWRYVARRYRDESTVAIYDLYNEPFGGPLPPGVFELSYLYPFYQRLSAAIREIDDRHPVAFQPEIFHSLGVPTPFATPLGIPNSIYMPHEYTIAYFSQRVDPTYTPLQDSVTRAYLGIAATEADIFQTPWAIGETGWTRSTSADGVGGPVPSTDAEAPRQFGSDFTAVADAQKINWLWFAYSSVDEAYGINYQDKPDLPLMTILARPFPRAVAGQVDGFSFDPDSGEYLQSSSAIFREASEIALPMTWQYPQGACVYSGNSLIGEISVSGKSTSPALRFDAKRQVLDINPLPSQLRITRKATTCA